MRRPTVCGDRSYRCFITTLIVVSAWTLNDTREATPLVLCANCSYWNFWCCSTTSYRSHHNSEAHWHAHNKGSRLLLQADPTRCYMPSHTDNTHICLIMHVKWVSIVCLTSFSSVVFFLRIAWVMFLEHWGRNKKLKTKRKSDVQTIGMIVWVYVKLRRLFMRL